eukprot:gene9722-10713_t
MGVEEGHGLSFPSDSQDWVWPVEITLRENEDDTGTVSSVNIVNRSEELLYSIDENPPWYLALGLGFQHYLTMFGATFGMPFILSVPLCFSHNPVIISKVMNTIFFVSGLTTLLQATFGVRLPIVQGGTFTFIAPIVAIMSVRGDCPNAIKPTAATNSSVTPATVLSTVLSSVMSPTAATTSGALAPTGAAVDEEWEIRIREIQGAIMVAALFQIIIGFSGLIGLIVRFIGPLTIVPTIALVGLPLFDTAAFFASAQWGIAMMTIILMTIFSQVVQNFGVPLPFYSKGKCAFVRVQIFKLFPILLAILLAWGFSAILTAANVFPKGSRARTDTRLFVIDQVSWLRVPYPGQWGTPTVRFSAVFGMLAGVLASMVESIGDYFACAKLSGAPPPPHHAINRGLGMEGIGCLLTGAWGTATGTTSYSENIGAIGITRVGSRRVIQLGALFMIVLAVIGKFGALFTTIPDPIVGGIFIIMFGMITAVGLSTLQYTNLNSMRNLFVLGFSLFFGMVVPSWVKKNSKTIDTGAPELDQIISVLLSTNMAVGGVTGFVLDNLLPGTAEERGILKWRSLFEEKAGKGKLASIHTYDLPFISRYLNKSPLVKYVPFLPYYGDSGSNEPIGMDTYKVTTEDA